MIPRVLSSSSLTGDAVVNHTGARLGSLKDIMIDIPRGEVAYGVVSRGGFAGLGEKLFAVPWRMFSLEDDSKDLILAVEEDLFENSPGFDPEHWPQFGDEAWGTQVHEHYGVAPYWRND